MRGFAPLISLMLVLFPCGAAALFRPAGTTCADAPAAVKNPYDRSNVPVEAQPAKEKAAGK